MKALVYDDVSKYQTEGWGEKRGKSDLKEVAGGFGAVIWLRFTLHENKAACFLRIEVHRPLVFLPRRMRLRLGCLHLYRPKQNNRGRTSCILEQLTVDRMNCRVLD